MKHEAIRALHSNVTTILGDDAYDADGNVVSYDADAVATKQTELETARDLDNLRAERNTKLTETDWVVTMHKELGTNIPAAWKTYRQALRDITDTYTSLDDVVWPEKP